MEQISREVSDDPMVKEHASETSKDLARIGLANDRLSRAMHGDEEDEDDSSPGD